MAPTAHFACGDNKLGRNSTAFRAFSSPRPACSIHNNGDGTFTEVSRGTDIEKALGKSLGVVATDINNDGRMDLFVANDTVQNFLFVNRGPGPNGTGNGKRSHSQAEVGFSENGRARSGMGVDAADFDGDGWQDLFVANVDQEMFSLYKNNKDETFRDVASRTSGAGHPAIERLGPAVFRLRQRWRARSVPANGHPDDMIENYSQAVKYKEPLLLFHQADGKLRNVSGEAGPVFAKSFSGAGTGDRRFQQRWPRRRAGGQ